MSRIEFEGQMRAESMEAEEAVEREVPMSTQDERNSSKIDEDDLLKSDDEEIDEDDAEAFEHEKESDTAPGDEDHWKLQVEELEREIEEWKKDDVEKERTIQALREQIRSGADGKFQQKLEKEAKLRRMLEEAKQQSETLRLKLKMAEDARIHAEAQMDELKRAAGQNSLSRRDWGKVEDLETSRHPTAFRSEELFWCRCPTPCQFTLSKAPGLRTSSPTQLVRMAVLLQGMPQLKEKEKVNRAKILSLHPLPFNYDRKVIDEDVWMMLAKCPTIVPTLRSSVLEKPFHEHYLQILKEEEETAGEVSTQILVLTLPGVNSEVVRTLGHPHREWKTIVEEKEDVNLVATRLKCSAILVIVPFAVDRATVRTWSVVMQAISASIDCILVAAPVQDQKIDWTLESEYAEVMEAMNRENGGVLEVISPGAKDAGWRNATLLLVGSSQCTKSYWECVNKVLEEKGGKKLKTVGMSEKTKHQEQGGRTTQKEVVRGQKMGFPKRKTFKNEPYKKKNTYLPEKH